MESSIKIAIIFPVFNGLKYTQKCLRSFYTEHNIDKVNAEYFVVIVDDGSTDGSSDWINKNYPQVKVINGTGDLWWSGGMNLGINYAIHKLNADYVVWWNNDIVASFNYFNKLVELLNTNDDNTIIGSKICLAQDKNMVWSMGGLFDTKTGKKSMIGAEQPDSDKLRQVTECDWLPGMGTITHRSVYKKIGMLDAKSFPQYHGDSDFTFRAKKNGYKIIVVPDLKIFNDTRHSGLKHDESLKRLTQSLFSIRSNFNIRKDFIYYSRHTSSILAYFILCKKYFTYIGGFFKWKLLGLFGLKRK